MQKPYTDLKLAVIDSSDTWYAQPRQIYDELCQMGIECLWMARPNHEGFRKNRVPAGYTTICIANNLGPIDFNTRQPLTLSHPPLERAHRSGADFIFIGDKTTFKRYFSSRPNTFYMPYAVNTGIYRPLELIEEIYDLGFVGNVKLGERARRLGLIQKHFRCFVGNNLFMEKANEAMNRCKIIFNTSDHREINMRVFEALATGKLLVTDRVDYLDELFKDGKHLVTYSDEEEMVEKISYYLKHENERREIARRGLEEVRRTHSYRHRARFIAEKVIQERYTPS
jgi:hypothetical protein